MFSFSSSDRHLCIFRYDGQPKFSMDLSGQKKDTYPTGAKDVKYLKNQWCTLDPDASDLSKLQDNINYACQNGDCTTLGYGCSCNSLDEHGRASYAFNQYFQIHNQGSNACHFNGLGKIVTQNISTGDCNFIIQIASSGPRSTYTPPLAFSLLVVLLYLLF